MTPGFNTAKRFMQLTLSLTLLFSCAFAPKTPLLLTQDFKEQNISRLVLMPVLFDRQYEPPIHIDLASELRTQAKTTLEKKGYEVILSEEKALSAYDAELTILVDFLFISDTYGDRHPAPVIDFEAEAWLETSRNGRELWRDRGVGKVGGEGRSRISYPDLARRMALDQLCDSLFQTLPTNPEN